MTRSRAVHLIRASLVGGFLCVSGCRDEGVPDDARAPLLASIDQAVVWQRHVRLEENPTVINVSPRVTPEPGGAYLVSDGMEQQLRFYAPDGRLRSIFGRRGSGPGEFQHLARAVRLNDRSLLVADMTGQLTRFDSTGTHVLRTGMSGLGPIYEMLVLDDSLVVIVGRKGGRMETPLGHEWNVATERLSRSFFPAPQGPRGYSGAYAFSGFADAALRGDTLAVLFALEDTIHMFVRDGREIGKLPLPFRGFRRITSPLSPQAPPDRFTAWLESFSAATDLFWLEDGGFLVQYRDQERSDRRFSLLRLRRDGKPVWEISGTPKLLAITPEASLVFVKRGAEAPNEWSIATLAAVR